MKILEQIKETRIKLTQIPSINHGGCAISAAVLFIKVREKLPRKRKKQIKIVYTWISTYYINNTYDNVINLLNNKPPVDPDQGFSCNHAMVRIGNILIDCDCIEPIKNYNNHRKIEFRTLKEVLPTIRNDKGWNPSFNKYRWRERINNLANKQLY